MFGRKHVTEEETEALDALRSGEPQKAYAALRPLLEYPGKLPDDRAWKSAWSTFAKVADALGQSSLGEAARKVATSPGSPNSLYALGYGLVEQGLHGPAATVLSRALDLMPREELILNELICAFEGVGANALACSTIEKSGLAEKAFIPRFLLAFNLLMTGDLAASRRWHQGLLDLLKPDHKQAAELRSMELKLREMYERADRVRDVSALNEQDLRGWTYVVNGSLLLHLSPYGTDEGMNGRYAYLSEEPDLLAEGIHRLSKALSAAQIWPACVYALPDRDSEILARVTAKVMRWELKAWPAAGTLEPGVIACYDLTNVDGAVVLTLWERHPGQLLWCHACNWTIGPPVVPDVITYFHQKTSPPWVGGLRFESGKLEKGPALEGSPDEVAATIQAKLPTLSDEGDLDALVTLAKHTLAFETSGGRDRFRTDSPVKSSRFL